MRRYSRVEENPVAQSVLERRREERVAGEGEVLLTTVGPEKFDVRARLVDLSPRGFRAAHDSPELASGSEVEFRHTSARGRARVVWTRILGDERESGFFILPR